MTKSETTKAKVRNILKGQWGAAVFSLCPAVVLVRSDFQEVEQMKQIG